MGFMETPRWPSVARTGRTIRVVARLAKLSGFGTVGAVGAHHARIRPTPNADPACLDHNQWLVRPEGGLVDAVKERIERAEKLRREAWEIAMTAWTEAGGKGAAGKKPRQPSPRRDDAVLAVEVVLSASPEFFRPDRPWEPGTYDPERMEAWRDASLAWLEERYGDRLVSAVLHLDEATPHIQAVFVPLTEDHRLSAKEVVGGPDDLREFQNSIGAALAPLGIQRGMEGSMAQHTDADEYYALVNRPRPTAPVVELDPMPVFGREKWREEQVARLQAQMDEAVREADAKAVVAELDREKLRHLPPIVAGLRAGAAAAVLEAETKAEARAEAAAEARVVAAEREAEDARRQAQAVRGETAVLVRRVETEARGRVETAEREAEAAHRKARGVGREVVVAEWQRDQAQKAAREATDALKAERATQATRVREMPLATVLEAAGWRLDADDPRYWHAPGSRVRVDGPKSAWDEERGKGAKNAIDLAMLLTGRGYQDAVAWLGEVVGREEAKAAARAAAEEMAEEPPEPFEPPAPSPAAEPARQRHLVERHRLPERMVEGLKAARLFIPRPRGFLLAMRDLRGAIVGAESYDDEGLVGLFRRSRPDRGGVRLSRGMPGQPRDVFLTESGLDALSLHELLEPHPEREQVFISAGGARSRVPWLRDLLTRGARLFVAYGAQPTSERAAAAIMAQHPTISARWTPKGTDWNAHLVAKAEASDASAGTRSPEDDEGWDPSDDTGIGGGRW